jgi:membrane protein implicated in regulation of membrane protease activity
MMLRKAFALLAGAILLILGFMASVVVFAIVAVLGLALWAYVWWKTRKLRQTMQAQAPTGGQVIDGEAVVVEEYVVETKTILPGDASRQ